MTMHGGVYTGRTLKCQYCGADITYSATRTRGDWYARNGRICGVTDEEKMPYAHRPYWNPETREFE